MPRRKTASRKIPRIGQRFEKLVGVQARLRGPGGCPWDRQQTHQSLRPYLVEEAYEVIEAIDRGDDERMAAELGDLLLQVLFHAQVAKEERRFDIGDVVDVLREKLIRRHPHVFGNTQARTAKEVLKRWEELKAEERRRDGRPESNGADSVLGNVPRNLPALSEAFQLTRRAANVGFDWIRLEGVLEKLAEETRELKHAARGAKPGLKGSPGKRRGAHARMEEEAGDLLFAAANVARFLGLDPELALKKANGKFQSRFRRMEQKAREGGKQLTTLSPEELERLWEQAKSARQLNS